MIRVVLAGLAVLLDAAGAPGHTIESLNGLYWGLAAVFGGATVVGLLYLVVRNRDKGGLWAMDRPLIPTLLGIVLMTGSLVFAVGASIVALPDTQQVPADTLAESDHVIHVNVTGSRWVWQFEHDGIEEPPNLLHVPARSVIIFNITSTDVLHSFYLPDYHVKKDAVPGKTTHMWIQTGAPDDHTAECAQFCGTMHAQMYAEVRVLPYEAWKQRVEEMRAETQATAPEVDVTVDVALDEWNVNLSTDEVATNTTVGLHVTNRGDATHNLTLEAPYENETPILDPGEDAWLVFTPRETGVVELWCGIAGHRDLGMEASLNITAQGGAS